MAKRFTIPGLEPEAAEKVADTLQQRLSASIDLQLTLKHIHWNVVGTNFIGVHEMLDPQYAAVSQMSDDIAERIAALGYEPQGTPGFVAKNRTWDDYSLNRATTLEHLAELDKAYVGMIQDHRKAMDEFDDLDLVSQDMLIGHLEQLEKFSWFVRAHLEDDQGALTHDRKRLPRQAGSIPTK